MRTPSAGASGVIIETERLRIRAHRDDDLADLVALAGNWEIAAGSERYRTPRAKPMGASG